jgi:GrpE
VSETRLTRWQEIGETLSDLLAWLEETRQWAEATAILGERCDAAANAAAPPWEVAHAETAMAALERTPEPAAGPEAGAASPDLFALLAALTTLRQEVKLQTRAARQDREQAVGALEQLSGAVALLEHRRQEDASRYQAEVQQAGCATVETLVELHDALSRAARQAGNIVESAIAMLRGWSQWQEAWDNGQGGGQRSTSAVSGQSNGPRADDGVGPKPGPRALVHLWGWLWRWARRAPGEPAPAAGSEPASCAGGPDAMIDLRRLRSEATSLADRLEGLTAGYSLSVQRLERALAAYGIEPMVCLGHPVDAERMEVVQIVADPAQPPAIVIDEVRRGYLQSDRVYRFAQVVATRSSRQGGEELPAATSEDRPE